MVRIVPSDPEFLVFELKNWKKKVKIWGSEPQRWSSDLDACQSDLQG